MMYETLWSMWQVLTASIIPLPVPTVQPSCLAERWPVSGGLLVPSTVATRQDLLLYESLQASIRPSVLLMKVLNHNYQSHDNQSVRMMKRVVPMSVFTFYMHAYENLPWSCR